MTNLDDDFRKNFEKAAGEAASDADELLDDELQKLLSATAINLESLTPNVTDRETYEKLIAVVKEATAHNMAIAELKQKIQALGKGAVGLAKDVAGRLGVG